MMYLAHCIGFLLRLISFADLYIFKALHMYLDLCEGMYIRGQRYQVPLGLEFQAVVSHSHGSWEQNVGLL